MGVVVGEGLGHAYLRTYLRHTYGMCGVCKCLVLTPPRVPRQRPLTPLRDRF